MKSIYSDDGWVRRAGTHRIANDKDRERERERQIEIERDFYFFLKCIWEIRTDNPSLAVKILNDTPRPNVPSQKGLVRNSQ